MKQEIITDPNPILREPAKKVESFDMELQTVIDNMVATMRQNNGIGLAAPQIGISEQIIVCELEPDQERKTKKEVLHEPFPLTVICNPKISSSSKEQCKMVEGCLSFPGLEIVVQRPKNIVISGQDRYGQPMQVKAGKLFGRVLQHELDHLNSTLMIDHLKEISVVFFAGGDFALKPLEYMASDKQYRIEAVITTPQISKVRGKETDNNRIKKLARDLKLKVIEVNSLKTETNLKLVKSIKADIGVVADFGLIIPLSVINFYKYKIVNIHPSLLPRYRGSSPIQATILNGDRFAGVTIIQINEKMDTGPIFSQYKIRMKGIENYAILKDYLSDLGGTLLLDTIPYYITHEITPKIQRKSKASYTKMIVKADGEVKSSDNPIEIDRKIRAYSTWPQVHTYLGDLRLTITAAHLDKNDKLIVERIKPAGKNEMTYSDFLNGYKKELTFGDDSDKLESN